LEEIFPLYNKARVNRAAKEGHHDVTKSQLLAQIKQWTRLYVDLNLIREFYGDEVAMYHSWMNHLLKWLVVPSLLAVVVTVFDNFLYTDENSPLNAVYSVMMVFWGTA